MTDETYRSDIDCYMEGLGLFVGKNDDRELPFFIDVTFHGNKLFTYYLSLEELLVLDESVTEALEDIEAEHDD